MSYRRTLGLVIVSCISSLEVHAQGLIHRLPPDGSWSRFRVSQQIWDAEITRALPEMPNPPELVIMESELLIQSVGTQQIEQTPCRWIEIVRVPSPMEKFGRKIALRLTIPENGIGNGNDCFDNCLKVLYSDSGGTAEELREESRKTYELERFRPLFPRLPAHAKKKSVSMFSVFGQDKPMSTVDYYNFPFSFNGKLSGGTSGTWVHSANYKMIVAPDAPFGVSCLFLHDIVNEEDYGPKQLAVRMKGSTQAILLESGSGATSALPNAEEP
jgi:hypothetical protein